MDRLFQEISKDSTTSSSVELTDGKTVKFSGKVSLILKYGSLIKKKVDTFFKETRLGPNH